MRLGLLLTLAGLLQSWAEECADFCSKCSGDRSLRILLIIGSTRDGRNADRVTKFVQAKLENAGHVVEFADPLNPELPLLRQAIHFYSNQSEAPESLQELQRKVLRSDAYILLSAEYNRLPPPALLNLIDHIPPKSFGFKTSAIVTYTVGRGGDMVVPPLRIFMVEMGALPIPYSLTIAQVEQVLDPNGKVLKDYIDKNFDKLLVQLEWFSHAMRNHRETFGAPKWVGDILSG